MWNDEELREEGIELLQQLPEPELKDEILKFFFGDRWKVYDVHNKMEIEHKCDLILSSITHGDEILIGIQIKSGKNGNNNISTNMDVVNEIRPCAEAALRNRYGDKGKFRLSKFYWITTGRISTIGALAITRYLDGPESTGGRVEVWDVVRLCDKLRESQTLREHLEDTSNDFVRALRINGIRRQMEKWMREREKKGVFAALLAYVAMRGCLLRKIPEISMALLCAIEGLVCLKEDPRQDIYYHRVIRNVLLTWEALLRGRPKVLDSQINRIEDILFTDEARDMLSREKSEDGCERLRFALDFECIFRQLKQLEKHYVNGPSGLSTLEMSRLLLRCGFAPAEPNLKARLERMRLELLRESEGSVDGGCSICTGTVVSCLALARDDGGAKRAADWLSSLDRHRYCHLRPIYTDIDVDQHALHFAAMVLQGFVDLNRESDVPKVIDIFFGCTARDDHNFYRDWMRFRNVERQQVSRYIFASFLRFLLCGGSLPVARVNHLREAIEALSADINNDCKDVQKPWMAYGARTNMSSFSLGLMLEAKGSYELARQVARLLRYRAREVAKGPGDPLLDSSVDRTVLFLEGYLDYWETLFCLEENGMSINNFLPALGPPADAATPNLEVDPC